MNQAPSTDARSIYDTSHVGHVWPPHTVAVDYSRARAFAVGLGVTDPVYTELEAAKAAGHPGIPTLPTFPIGLSHHRSDRIWEMLELIGVDPGKVLHGTQKFVFHRPIYVGDVLTGTMTLTDIVDRKAGALTFVDSVVAYVDAQGAPVVDDLCTLVVRNR